MTTDDAVARLAAMPTALTDAMESLFRYAELVESADPTIGQLEEVMRLAVAPESFGKLAVILVMTTIAAQRAEAACPAKNDSR